MSYVIRKNPEQEKQMVTTRLEQRRVNKEATPHGTKRVAEAR